MGVDYEEMPWNMTPSIEVYETDKQPQATGILNSDGVMLYRQPEIIRMGFHGSQKSIQIKTIKPTRHKIK